MRGRDPSAERAHDLRHEPAYIAAASAGAPFRFGNTLMSFYNQPDLDFASSGHRVVAEELFRLSGMSIGDMDAAMVYDHFTGMVLMALEDFGFCAKGEGGPYAAEATSALDGPFPVNTHGGNLAEAYTHGMTHVNEAVRQIHGTAINQIDGAATSSSSAVPDPRHERHDPDGSPMSDQMPGLPGPAPDPTTEGYWLAAGRGSGVQVCSRAAPPPSSDRGLLRCNSLDWSWAPHNGRGTVYTYTWTDRPVVPALAPLGVYNVTVVELDGTQGVVRILSRVTDVERDDLVVGLPVEVHFDPAGDDVALPLFRPRGQPRTGNCSSITFWSGATGSQWRVSSRSSYVCAGWSDLLPQRHPASAIT